LPKLRNKPAPLAGNQAILSNAPEKYDLILKTQGCIYHKWAYQGHIIAIRDA